MSNETKSPIEQASGASGAIGAFWNTYLVRYAAPTVLAYLELWYLLNQKGTWIPDIKQFQTSLSLEHVNNFPTLFIVASVSIFYMYLGSMPILVLHTFRIYFWKMLKMLKKVVIFIFTCKCSKQDKDVLNKNIVSFYKALSWARTRDNRARGDYIKSYRELREHGNAFLNMASSLVLTYFLSVFHNTFVVLFIWTVIGGVSWFCATALEINMASEY
ncbi:hypothetical protein FY534_07820 [Alicyclobacillus sp. TC]|uniref:ABC transmembrane type-1 domain-containing protein n=1 Tax=Alicyclobacillus tolerans TaxID=90970 RepID=A0ABT9M027_9BACL|nr:MULTISPECIES: hypothetical protein [Alicyclobacillus]MDP9729867.1 hypothetical protein [Alicyclobacillus tengchongensis]QRF23585.1 hypothetical protein FY534_07820 [Alicyclobacillus sp. TC]